MLYRRGIGAAMGLRRRICSFVAFLDFFNPIRIVGTREESVLPAVSEDHKRTNNQMTGLPIP